MLFSSAAKLASKASLNAAFAAALSLLAVSWTVTSSVESDEVVVDVSVVVVSSLAASRSTLTVVSDEVWSEEESVELVLEPVYS